MWLWIFEHWYYNDIYYNKDYDVNVPLNDARRTSSIVGMP